MANKLFTHGGRPIDGNAQSVIRTGVHYERKRKHEHGYIDQREPYPIRAMVEVPPNFRHLIGFKFGLLTVIGMALKPKRWAVRCACGMYTLRSTKAVINPKNAQDACEQCQHQLWLKRHDFWLRTGKDIHHADVPGAPDRGELPKVARGGPFRSRPLGPKQLSVQPYEPFTRSAKENNATTAMADAMKIAMDAKSAKDKAK